MDWGLAKLLHSGPASGANALMNAKGVVGTADYLSPEQARGNPEDVDTRSDVFGIGALLFEILSGQGPYGKASLSTEALLARATVGEITSIDAVCARIASRGAFVRSPSAPRGRTPRTATRPSRRCRTRCARSSTAGSTFRERASRPARSSTLPAIPSSADAGRLALPVTRVRAYGPLLGPRPALASPTPPMRGRCRYLSTTSTPASSR
jgi:serine/threonine protein kinase